MAQYIDKCRVVAEIKERIDRDNESAASYPSNSEHDSFYRDREKVYKSLLHFLDTLEVKKEILDKKSKTDLMRKCVHKAYERGYDMGVLQTTNKIKHNTKEVDLKKEYEEFVVEDPIFGNFITNDTMGMELAKHFFELGLKAQKGEGYEFRENKKTAINKFFI